MILIQVYFVPKSMYAIAICVVSASASEYILKSQLFIQLINIYWGFPKIPTLLSGTRDIRVNKTEKKSSLYGAYIIKDRAQTQK